MINFFKNEYRFLSNFYPVEVEFTGIIFPTVEHAYQAAKTENEKIRIYISKLRTPGQAKRFANTIKLREGWDEIKYDIMYELLQQKFSYDELEEKLKSTGRQRLIEGNYWHDNYWGWCYCNGCKNNIHYNNLGNLLMIIRNTN